MGSHSLSQRAREFLALSTRQDLAEWLGISDRGLRYILYTLDSSRKYATFTIKKRRGGDRKIDAPHPALKHLQHKLLTALYEVAPASGIAKGYVKGRSIVDHAKLHRHQRFVILADLRDFFPTITFPRVRGALLAKPLLLHPSVATCVAQLCCKDGVLPQGAPTSPVLSNLICRSLDHKLLRLAKSRHFATSRYADDICLSTSQRQIPHEIAFVDNGRWVAGNSLVNLIKSCGFELNDAKFKVKDAKARQLVTGLVVNDGVALPRLWRRQLRVLLHLVQRYGENRAAEIAAAWTNPSASRHGFTSIEQVIRGKSHFAQYVDSRCGRKFSDALFRSYPTQRHLLPRPLYGTPFRLMTEGKTDILHMQAAFNSFISHNEFTYLKPRFLNFPGETGDVELLKTLYRIAKSDIPELTIGVFDGDNPKLMKDTGLCHGNYVRLGSNVFAICLASSLASEDVPFCIELLYPREILCAMTSDSRRVFLPDEFYTATGLSLDGIYRRDKPKARAVLVSDQVTRVSDGYSSLLTKASFAEMVFNGVAPFDNMSFDGFAPTFRLIGSIVDMIYGRNRGLGESGKEGTS
jgi:RNA-directed DNA polymerase